jgi:hypothetical protein
LEESRWVIPPNGVVNLVVQFASDTVGRFSDILAFDVVCGEKTNKVTLIAACDYPRISTEARCAISTITTNPAIAVQSSIKSYRESQAVVLQHKPQDSGAPATLAGPGSLCASKLPVCSLSSAQ